MINTENRKPVPGHWCSSTSGPEAMLQRLSRRNKCSAKGRPMYADSKACHMLGSQYKKTHNWKIVVTPYEKRGKTIQAPGNKKASYFQVTQWLRGGLALDFPTILNTEVSWRMFWRGKVAILRIFYLDKFLFMCKEKSKGSKSGWLSCEPIFKKQLLQDILQWTDWLKRFKGSVMRH